MNADFELSIDGDLFKVTITFDIQTDSCGHDIKTTRASGANGKAIEIKCIKSTRTSQTVYKDLNGNEINVNDIL